MCRGPSSWIAYRFRRHAVDASLVQFLGRWVRVLREAQLSKEGEPEGIVLDMFSTGNPYPASVPGPKGEAHTKIAVRSAERRRWAADLDSVFAGASFAAVARNETASLPKRLIVKGSYSRRDRSESWWS